MNNEIQKFDFRGASLRTLTDKAGEPWFVAKDVCDILELGTEHLRRDLDEDEVTEATNLPNWQVGSNGGRVPLIISEPGLYKLVMRSRKPEAKEFQRWVTHEVLPQIRRTGGYIPTSEPDSDEDIMARAVLVAQKTIERKNQQLQAKDAQIKVLEPKARFADAVAASDGTCLVGELAKMLRQNGMDIGQNRLFRLLQADGYLGKSGSNRNVPTQRAMDLGLFRIKETTVTHADGHTGQPHPEGHGQGAALFHRPVLGSYPADVGSGCVMDKNMQRAMLSAFDDLRNRLITATQPKTSVDLIDSTFAMSSIGGRGLEQLREAAAAAAVLGQMEAVCRFLLEILYPAGVGEGVDDLLAAESDEIDSLREFPNLGILRGLLDSRGDAGSAGDVSSRLFECLSLCEHDSSPNCSARTSEMRDDTDFRRGPGGSPNAARHHTRKGGA